MRARFINRVIPRAAQWLGFSVADVTPKDELRGLFCELAPWNVGRDLIRLGPCGDGGYLVPDDLENLVGCFSPGVAQVSGFENDLAKRGVPCFLADASVDAPSSENPLFAFEKKYVGAWTAGDFMTLDDWIARSGVDDAGDLLLQMDIEGSEYEVVLACPSSLFERFRIVVIEFHMLGALALRPFFSLAARAFRKLLDTHICVHIHPNNYGGLVRCGPYRIPALGEYTFLRRDRILEASPVTTLPHPLDTRNTDRPSIPVPPIWLASLEQHRVSDPTATQ